MPVAALLGMQRWKRRAIAAAFSADGPPPFAGTAAQALRLARGRGAVACWATRVPPGFAEACAEARVPLLLVEDGFLRSVGLGAEFAPAASLCVDAVAHYDPRAPSRLEALLAAGGFGAPLLARAAALRARIVARGVTKYNLPGPAAPLPDDGRPRLLVLGQVEDDASVRLGALGAVRTNLGLLRAVRAAHPEAAIIFRPHPDVRTGYRRGHVPARLLRGLADHVAAGGDVAALYPQVQGVHAMTSLGGFEALLRGVPVTTWGAPFYAGWGLATDMHPPPRRGIPRTLDELVAAALLLYPRYTHPLSGARCEAEDVLDLLERPAAWPPLPPLRRLWLHGWRAGGRLLGWGRRPWA